MKMILIITNKDDITVDFIVKLLRRDGIEYYRLNTEDLFTIVDIRYRVDKDQLILVDNVKRIKVDFANINSVYYRRPGLPNFNNVSEISEIERHYLMREAMSILDGVYKRLRHCFWINDVFKIREAENKLYQLEIAKDIGFEIPETILSNDVGFIKDNFKQINKENLIIKPVRTGNIDPKNADKVIFTSEINTKEITYDNIKCFPAYIQRKIPKRADLRSIVVNDTVFTAEILSQNVEDAKTDWRKSSKILEHRQFSLPLEIEQKCIEITKSLGLIYSAIDFALDENGKYIFLECNPNGQWAWIENRLRFPISEAIERLLIDGSRIS